LSAAPRQAGANMGKTELQIYIGFIVSLLV
jgi:hypothetical protein